MNDKICHACKGSIPLQQHGRWLVHKLCLKFPLTEKGYKTLPKYSNHDHRVPFKQI